MKKRPFAEKIFPLFAVKIVADDGPARAPAEGLGQVLVPVLILPAQGEKDLPRF